MAECKSINPDDVLKFSGELARRLIRSGDCFNYVGSYSGMGYGRICVGGRAELKAHRVAYALAYQRDPMDLKVLHTCDNPKCCNPDHLFLGTYKDNNNDRAKKGRSVYGSRSPHAKLKEADIPEIKARRHSGE